MTDIGDANLQTQALLCSSRHFSSVDTVLNPERSVNCQPRQHRSSPCGATHFLDLSRVLPVHLLPFGSDASSTAFPHAMFGSVSSFPSFSCGTNPTYLRIAVPQIHNKGMPTNRSHAVRQLGTTIERHVQISPVTTRNSPLSGYSGVHLQWRHPQLLTLWCLFDKERIFQDIRWGAESFPNRCDFLSSLLWHRIIVGVSMRNMPGWLGRYNDLCHLLHFFVIFEVLRVI